MAEDPGVDQRPPVGNRRAGFRPRHLWYLLLLVQFAAVLITGIYTRETPKLAGIPFFYWYQFAWIILSVILTFIVYVATREK
ncbi:MAG: DUF3311 domain-containing protein [Solirubrobacteraceae bacterium]